MSRRYGNEEARKKGKEDHKEEIDDGNAPIDDLHILTTKATSWFYFCALSAGCTLLALESGGIGDGRSERNNGKERFIKSEAGWGGLLEVKVERDETSMPNNKKARRETSSRSIGV